MVIMKHINEYSKFRESLNEGVNLKASHLSSEDYQKAKKLKAFDSADWTWNPKSQLYDKVNESVVNEAFSRMSKDTIENELYKASQELSKYYDWLKAGNDSGKGKTLDSIIDLLKKCKSNIKRFNKPEEVKGTAFESLDEKAGPCWDGYKIGSPKTKISSQSGKRVNNCVPIDEDITEVNEAEDYKYKKYVSKAFDKISDAMFEFRNAMGVKQLGQADPKLKKRLEAIQTEIFALRREMKSEGLTESEVTEGIFDSIADPTKALHFETDPKRAELMKMELGKKQGETNKKKQIEGGEYSLRKFRKEIKYDTTGKDLGVFRPGSYMSATSTIGDGPHKKAVAKIKWNQKKYDQWLEDVASNDGWKNAFDMAQNAKQEPGLISWVKKTFRVPDPMQRIQWDIESFAESVDESAMSELDLLAKEAKDFKAFTKEVFKEFKNLPKKADTLKWLEELYNDAINEAEKAEGDRSKLSAEIEKALKDKATESGVPIGLLRLVMRRGLDAWNSSHRAGVPQVAWGYARVNAFLEKGKGTWGKADADIAKEVRDEGKAGKLPIKNPSEFTKKEREA
jgi:hypothetical protein